MFVLKRKHFDNFCFVSSFTLPPCHDATAAEKLPHWESFTPVWVFQRAFLFSS